MTPAETEDRREDPPAGDPNAPLPDDAPLFMKLFYDAVNNILNIDPSPSAKDFVQAALTWAREHQPK